MWACIGAETSAHRNILIELTSKSGNKQRPKIVTEINEIPRALVKSPMKPPERKQPNPILNPRNPKQADKLRINPLCLKFEDIFCFCVENLCGYQTIGWLVKFRGRTFESFFDINMRCIKILF